MTETEMQSIKIMAEPVSARLCKFVVDRPVHKGSYYFSGKEATAGSPLAERLFDVPGVTAVLVSHDRVTITQDGSLDWRAIGRQIGQTIRQHIAGGQPAVNESLIGRLPPADEIRNRVEEVLMQRINPAIAAHGGFVRLIDVRDNDVFLQLGGGCQGCGMADVTLKQGIEVEIRAAVPEVGEVFDTTDHAAGRNPFYQPSRK